MLTFPARLSFIITTAPLVLASCISAASPPGITPVPAEPPGAKGHNSGSTYKVSKGLLFVAVPDPVETYNDVQIYDTRQRHPKVLARITDGASEPQSVCVDGQRTLYVTNGNGDGGSITEYALGSTVPKAQITQGVNGPTFCAIDDKGNLWVTNRGGNVNVTEYLRGSSVPHKVLTDGLTYPLGIAIDHAGNLYVSNHDGSTDANIQVYPPGQSSPSRTITNGVSWPDGIAVNASGTLYVTNVIPGNLEEYRSGSSKPSHTITQEMNGPVAITFAQNGRMYVSNTGAISGGSGPPNTIIEFPPGSQNPSKRTISQGLYGQGGIALYPPSLP